MVSIENGPVPVTETSLRFNIIESSAILFKDEKRPKDPYSLRSWKDRISFLYNNEFMADIHFLLHTENRIVRVPGHKFILGGCGTEFYSFFFILKEPVREIKVYDISVNSMLDFMGFIYKGELELSTNNVYDLVVLARRYGVHKLEEICSDFLQHLEDADCGRSRNV